MPATQIERLPESILAWQSVLTHVHTAGSSACSGQQSLDQIDTLARALGFSAVVVTEHSSSPERPRLFSLDDPEARTIGVGAAEIRSRYGSLSRGFVRYGLECNTAQVVKLSRAEPYGVEIEFRVDTPPAILDCFPSYVVGSFHGDAGVYKHPVALMTAIKMLCEHPRIDALGHITRYVSDVSIDWAEVGRMAADTGTIIELNQNLWFKECCPKNVPEPDDSFNFQFHRRFIEAVAGTKAHLIIGADVHNEGMLPTAGAKPGDWQTSVGSVIAYHQFLADCGLRASRVLNSDLAWYDRVLTTPKHQRSSFSFA